jgi:5-methylcytosine-specific restriction endonuclease McrA
LASCGRFKADQIRQLLIDQEYRCANPFCRADLMEIAPHIDHKIPLTRGGTNDIANLQWLCAPCNVRKWTYKMDEWLAKIGG